MLFDFWRFGWRVRTLPRSTSEGLARVFLRVPIPAKIRQTCVCHAGFRKKCKRTGEVCKTGAFAARPQDYVVVRRAEAVGLEPTIELREEP